MEYWDIGASLPAPHSRIVSMHVRGYREGNCQKEQFGDRGQLPGLRGSVAGVSVGLRCFFFCVELLGKNTHHLLCAPLLFIQTPICGCGG